HPHEEPLLARESPGEREGILLPHLPKTVDDGSVEVGGDESRPHPLELVLAPLLAMEDGRSPRLRGDHPDGRVLVLQVTPHPRDGPSGTSSIYEDVQLPV